MSAIGFTAAMAALSALFVYTSKYFRESKGDHVLRSTRRNQALFYTCIVCGAFASAIELYCPDFCDYVSVTDNALLFSS